MWEEIGRIWRGDVPLSHVFWNYTIIYGSLGNLFTTIAALGMLVADFPTALVLLIFLLPLPYNALVVIGVWRSAANYSGPERWANLARVVVVAWATLATVV
jgi:hypothetical protein